MAPGRLIFNVFFCVTAALSPPSSTEGSAESGMREVLRAEADDSGEAEAVGVADGAVRSDGRFRRIVFGPSFSGATPMAESSEMRDVLDLAA